MPVVLRLVRESRWARIFETEFGDYFDSKFRTGECDADGRAWAEAWLAADEDERIELESAFVFMSDEAHVSAALALVGEVDAAKRNELGSRWIAPDDELPERHHRFIDAYRRALEEGLEELPVIEIEVLDATWFRVRRTILGLEIEHKTALDHRVSEREFLDERDAHESATARHLYDVWWEVHGRGRGRE